MPLPIDNISAGCGGSSEAKCSMSDTESDEQQSGRLTGENSVQFWKISSIRGRPIFEVVLLITYRIESGRQEARSHG